MKMSEISQVVLAYSETRVVIGDGEKKGQPVSWGQVQLTPFSSPWKGPRGCRVPRTTGLGSGDMVTVWP